MTYNEIRNYMINLEGSGIRPGTGSIKRLLSKLGDPQDKIRCVHVAGTNGKGSVCAMLSQILKESGYKVGRYSSPAVSDPKEVIRIDEEPVSEELYIEAAQRVIDTGEDATVFEFETAMAFYIFEKIKCDAAVIETGMGGRDDATNVLKEPAAVILTSISLDHMRYLGNDVEAIAQNKCGIIRDGCPVISSCSNKDIKIIDKECRKHNAVLISAATPQNIRIGDRGIVFDIDGFKDTALSLFGTYQAENASAAIEAAGVLKKRGFTRIDEDKIRKALLKVSWPGRYDKLSLTPAIIADGAHNTGAVTALINAVKTEYPDKKIIVMMAVFADKEYDVMLELLSGISDSIICTTSGKERSLSPGELALCAKKYFKDVSDHENFEEAFREGWKKAKSEDALLLVCGSLSNIKPLLFIK